MTLTILKNIFCLSNLAKASFDKISNRLKKWILKKMQIHSISQMIIQ